MTYMYIQGTYVDIWQQVHGPLYDFASKDV